MAGKSVEENHSMADGDGYQLSEVAVFCGPASVWFAGVLSFSVLLMTYSITRYSPAPCQPPTAHPPPILRTKCSIPWRKPRRGWSVMLYSAITWPWRYGTAAPNIHRLRISSLATIPCRFTWGEV